MAPGTKKAAPSVSADRPGLETPRHFHSNVEVAAEEQRVEARSAGLKKQLGLRDLVIQQIVFVTGTFWVGVAAKLGPSQIFFWLAAITFFYLPTAAVVIYLTRRMPLEGGLYQW